MTKAVLGRAGLCWTVRRPNLGPNHLFRESPWLLSVTSLPRESQIGTPNQMKNTISESNQPEKSDHHLEFYHRCSICLLTRLIDLKLQLVILGSWESMVRFLRNIPVILVPNYFSVLYDRVNIFYTVILLEEQCLLVSFNSGFFFVKSIGESLVVWKIRIWFIIKQKSSLYSTLVFCVELSNLNFHLNMVLQGSPSVCSC